MVGVCVWEVWGRRARFARMLSESKVCSGLER